LGDHKRMSDVSSPPISNLVRSVEYTF